MKKQEEERRWFINIDLFTLYQWMFITKIASAIKDKFIDEGERLEL